MLKLVVLDTETTGLWSDKHALIQLSGKVVISNEVVSEFNFKMRPFMDDEVDDNALRINRITLEELASYPTPEEVLPEVKKYFYQFLDHGDPKDLLTPVGFNVRFDTGFLRAFFTKQNGWNSYKNIFSGRTIDVQSMVLMYLHANGLDNLDSYSQVNCAKAMGIELNEDSAHDAVEDSNVCFRMFMKISEKMKL